MSTTDLAGQAPSRLRAAVLLTARGAAGLAALIAITLFLAATTHAAGSEWTAQRMMGPSYTGTTFDERYRYENPQILPFADGTAEAVWTQPNAMAGIYGRHLGADGTPTTDPYAIWTRAGTEAIPYTTLAPLTGSLGVAVMDTRISNNTPRIIRARLIGPTGATGATFDLDATPGSTPVGSLDVASNGDGTATVAWANYDGTAYSVKERQIDAGGASGPVRTVSDPIGRPENSSATNSVEVRGHGDGTASIAWSESPDTSGVANLKVRRVGPAGVMGSIHQIASGWVRAPRIAAHPDGSVTAVWNEQGNWRTVLYVTRVTANGNVGAPEHVCALGVEQSNGGQQCLDIASGAFGSASFRYDTAANGNGSSTVVARRPQDGDVVSWQVDNQGRAGPRATLETSPGNSDSPEPQIAGDGAGNTVAMWTGSMPSSTLPALHAARIEPDNTVVGDQTLFPLTDRGNSAQVLAGPALTGSGAGLPIWSAWSDWTADPGDDPTTTRQVYAARYPRISTPPGQTPLPGSKPRPPGPTWPVAPSPACPAVKLIGAAGSGENGGPGTSKSFAPSLGAPVGKLDRWLRAEVGAQRYASLPLYYDAVPVDGAGNWFKNLDLSVKFVKGRFFASDYRRSVDVGVSRLVEVLRTDPCAASTRYILAGYSQGAHVVGDALASGRIASNVRKRITAAVLFGDPKFNSDGNNVSQYGSFESGDRGIRGARRDASLAAYKSKVLTFCRDGDGICDAPNGFAPHWMYPSAETGWAADLALRKLTAVVGPAKAQVPLKEVSVEPTSKGLRVRCATGKENGWCLAQLDVEVKTPGGRRLSVHHYKAALGGTKAKTTTTTIDGTKSLIEAAVGGVLSVDWKIKAGSPGFKERTKSGHVTEGLA